MGDKMHLYNTLNKKIEEFVPYSNDSVKMYTCGPTVYHFAHIGNLRTYIFEDVLEKSLVYLGYKVDRVMNITDVGHMTSDSDTGEDKMLKGAEREHKTVWEIADFYTDAFFKDTDALNIKKPAIVEKASNHIDTYIKIATKLLNEDKAYISGGNVYFDITKAPNYYALSGKSSDDLIVGAREDVTDDIHKRNPGDFGLWFTNSKFENQVMQWDSPWGRGYPGWHIECTGLALNYLGENLDIHCGGVDNIFPHHTNEIAQSEAYIGHDWCKYWLHGEHLNDTSGKMSKSSGEFLTLALLQEKGYNPLAYRLLCLQSHYRKQLVFTYEALDTATSTYTRLLNKVKNITNNSGELNKELFDKYNNLFKNALSDDLNTANALTTLFDLLKDDNLNDVTKEALVKEFDKVFSLDLLKVDEFESDLEVYIQEKIAQRDIAKANKDYEASDKIRDELKEKGILIKDTREGTTYELIK
jgi:cysteinyl-tRNA synthetase